MSVRTIMHWLAQAVLTKPSQADMYYAAERRSADLNDAFMEMVKHPTNPMTKRDLAALIAKRPHVYARFAGFMTQLPD